MSSRQLEVGIDRTRAFIASRRAEDGFWHEFQTLAGRSDEWVTAFIAYSLEQSDASDTAILFTIRSLMRRQRPRGGWGYNATVPTDCDSTAWVLMACSAMPMWRPSSIERALGYIKEHRVLPSGGFSTYSPADGIDGFVGAADDSVVGGWTGAHSCVTGAAVQALLLHGEPSGSDVVQDAAAYLLRQRTPAGTWPSYWWAGYAYGTYQCMRALSMCRILDERASAPVAAFLLSQQRRDGGWNDGAGETSEAFATAFNVLSLLLFPQRERLDAATNGVDWLLAHQRPDGGWATHPILRIPPPMVTAPDAVRARRVNESGTGVVLEDSGGFTSAAALWALSVYASIHR